jgi:hypothetical protein
MEETKKQSKTCWSELFRNWEMSGLKLINGALKDPKCEEYSAVVRVYKLDFLLASKAFASSHIAFVTRGS